MNKLSKDVLEIIALSREEAGRLQNSEVTPEHLLLGIIRYNKGITADVFRKGKINNAALKEKLENVLQEQSQHQHTAVSTLEMNDACSNILRLCRTEAKHLAALPNSQHLLLAILRSKQTDACKILEEMHLDYPIALSLIIHGTSKTDTNKPEEDNEDDLDFFFDDKDDEESPLMDDMKNSFIDDEDEDDKDYYDIKDFEDDDEDDDEDAEDEELNKQDEQLAFNLLNETDEAKKQKSLSNKSRSKRPNTPYLNNYGTDITQLAIEGKLDPTVGREKEIERIAQILCRRTKHNPILLGDPGVGKSAIVEGLATRIVKRTAPRLLLNKRIINLDLTSVVAGTKYRGQFEERLKRIMKELDNNPNIILFIDEIHTLIGAGATPGAMDAANILKPSLARSNMQCIGATTLKEYSKTIEKDGALTRRFQKVMVKPTTTDETYEILKNIKCRYEEHHNVTYTDDALKACVTLTNKYITDRQLPDKAIDAMDEAGSRTHLINLSTPKNILRLEKDLEIIKNKKTEAAREQNFALAADFRNQEILLEKRLDQCNREQTTKNTQNRITVDTDMVAETVSVMCDVPVTRIAQDEGMKLKGMKEALTHKVIAQDKAIEVLSKAIIRNRIGLKDPNRPIGCFLFVGPTGVGKTYLVKQLAEYMFGTKDAIIRIDMTEYMEKHSVSKLVGAPPGYIGYDEGGQLTEQVRRRPYSIVLFDEIEKAHTDVYNILLQVMDDGRLTDNSGVTVDFRNTIIIMTSNCGTKQVKEYGRGIGFGTNLTDDGLAQNANSIMDKAIKKQFAPEFLNRLDEIISFNQLDLPAIVKIVDLELEGLSQRMSGIGHPLTLTQSAKEFIAKKGYDAQFGARPLKRALQKFLEDDLCQMLIDNKLPESAGVTADYAKDDAHLTFSFQTSCTTTRTPKMRASKQKETNAD